MSSYIVRFYKCVAGVFIRGKKGIFCTHNNDTNLSPQGRQFDQHGNIDPWWDSSSLQKFQNKAQCIIGRTQVRSSIFTI